MVGSASGPGSTFKTFLGSTRVWVPLSNKIRVRIFGPVKTSSLKARVYFTFRVLFRSVSRSIQSIFSHRRVRTDELDTCAEPPTWLARSQKIACTRTGCATVREPSWWRKWRNKDGAWTAEVYFGLNPHLRVCVKCGAEVK